MVDPIFQEYYPFADTIITIMRDGWSWSLLPRLFADTFLLALVGWVVAWTWERYQLKQLTNREEDVANVSVIVGPKLYRGDEQIFESDLIKGSIVLSHDAFRSFTILITRLFGGNIKHYEKLLDHARREALVRLKEDAIGQGFERVINLKFVTTSIKRTGPSTVEVLAYGTGVRKPL